VDQLQQAVNSYYSQFEEQGQAAAPPQAIPETEPEGEAAVAEPEAEGAGEGLEAAPEPVPAGAPEEENGEQSGTMEDAGSPSQKLELAGIPEGAGVQGEASGGE
jgi:hypothetical protein